MKTSESKTFTEWMEHLSKEHDDQLKAEANAAARQELFAKIRKVVLATVGVALLTSAFIYRVEVGHYLHRLVPAKPESEAKTQTKPGDGPVVTKEDARANFGANMKLIRGVASERDQILDGISDKK